jgi:hypothetical protein
MTKSRPSFCKAFIILSAPTDSSHASPMRVYVRTGHHKHAYQTLRNTQTPPAVGIADFHVADNYIIYHYMEVLRVITNS